MTDEHKDTMLAIGVTIVLGVVMALAIGLMVWGVKIWTGI
jgi:hypothetical protein